MEYKKRRCINLKWLKLEQDIFSNRKIQILAKESDGDTYFRVWIQLLTKAMECNLGGKLAISENVPLNSDDLSKIIGKSKNTMKKILNKFLELNMIILENNTYVIKNWGKYQSVDTYEKHKENNRLRQQKYRNKTKENNVKVMLSNDEEVY